jgi:hypothetical protein
MGGIIVLAFIVNLVELLCTAGLPALYTAILTSHGLPPWKYYAYLTLYVAAYMLDDAVLVTIGVVTLGKWNLQERAGRWLKLLSELVILTLDVLLLVRPSWLGFLTGGSRVFHLERATTRCRAAFARLRRQIAGVSRGREKHAACGVLAGPAGWVRYGIDDA